ncbi:MAG: DNA polymerase III subunit alpha [Ruminococcus sp.]|nr:DNA polymerase III subunit alpha [Ruminococcus sp.]
MEVLKQFTHLHVHTEYSLLDGACRVKELISYVKKLGQTSLAITDHGCMYGAIEFYNEALKQGIKPIIGCEMYVAPRSRHDRDFALDKSPYHLILLCENYQGYSNLIKLVSLSNIEGFYSKPRVDLELLQRYHNGLICLSGCVVGEISRNILNDDYKKAKEVALKYQEIFGRGNYFLEVQNHGLQNELKVLPSICRLSSETGIPLVATNDVHYTKKSDAEMQDILMCIQMQTTIDNKNRMKFQTDEFYIKSYDEMYSLFKNLPQALENTQTIANRCNVSFEFGKIKLPKYKEVGIYDNVKYFKDMCYDGLKRRYGNNPSRELIERMNYEIEVITKMGYVDYFLIVWDYINFAKTNDIPVGCGRGSGAGSICAYCMGITDIDPIKYSLLFERFLNPERVSMPDFDIDFCIEGRQKVIDYVTQRYGSDKVAQIITFGTMGAKGAIRDVGRAMGMPFNFCAKISNYVPNKIGMTIQKALEENPDFKHAYDTDINVKNLVDTAKRLEGMPRNVSTHAAGVIISAVPISDIVPIKKNGDVIVIQYTMGVLESLGLLKMDFLGLRNLTVIKDCQNYIKAKGLDFNINDIPIDDPKVYSMLADGKTMGVFQFESSGITDVLMQLIPKNIEDLIAVLSLYRPGPMESIPKYIQNKHNPECITYSTPLLKPILDVTYGCIVYQEQVMEIFRSLAGYSYGRADIVRRAMAKKKHDVMLKERESFIYGDKNPDGSINCVGAVANGVPESVASNIFDEMMSFASYAFNKSHATCYAYLAYQTAYLRCHYFTEYMASLMSSVLLNTSKLMEYITECERNGVKVLKPNINESMENFTVIDGCIKFGLLAIKNLGKGMIEKIITERTSHGDFTSIKDFCKRMADSSEINKRAIESLIKAGAFDGLLYNRKQMLSSLDSLMDVYSNNEYSNEIEGQLDLFGEMSNVANKDYIIPDMEEYSNSEILSMEKEITGMYISGHPLKQYSIYIDTLHLDTISSILSRFSDGMPLDRVGLVCYISKVKNHTTKNGSQMCFLTVEDLSQSIDVVVFPNLYQQVRNALIGDTIVYINGKVSPKDDTCTILPDIITPIEEFVKNPLYYVNAFGVSKYVKALSLCIYATSEELSKASELCDSLNVPFGKIPIKVYWVDKRKRFAPKSNPRTEFNTKTLEVLQRSNLRFKFA